MTRIATALTLLTLLTLLAQPVGAADSLLERLRGTWTGTGDQSGETWAMELSIVPGGARVDYPDFPCGGVWVISAETDDTANAVEWLSYGHNYCLDELDVVATLNRDKSLTIRWLDHGRQIAVARLTSDDARFDTGKKGAGQK